MPHLRAYHPSCCCTQRQSGPACRAFACGGHSQLHAPQFALRFECLPHDLSAVVKAARMHRAVRVISTVAARGGGFAHGPLLALGFAVLLTSPQVGVQHTEHRTLLAEGRHHMQQESLHAAPAKTNRIETFGLLSAGEVETCGVSHREHHGVSGHALPGCLTMTALHRHRCNTRVGKQAIRGFGHSGAATAFRNRCLPLRTPILKHHRQTPRQTRVALRHVNQLTLSPMGSLTTCYDRRTNRIHPPYLIPIMKSTAALKLSSSFTLVGKI